MTTQESFLTSAKKQFLYYKTLGEKAMYQLESEQLFFSANEDTNSIYIIVKHLHGNMLSRWTDFLTTDGEKEWRNRDSEFEDDETFSITGHAELFSGSPETLKQVQGDTEIKKKKLFYLWNEGWDCLFKAINALTPEQLSHLVYIRNEGQTVVEAINRQLCHYSYHVGQIVFYAKMLKKSDWESLSIPKNKSKDYNADKFSKDKSVKNFTDDELDRLK